MDTLNAEYWNNRCLHHETGWDIGNASTPLTGYTDQLTDKSMAILIPGCGNAYEAEYLLAKGFTNITLLDISPALTNELTIRLQPYIGHGLQIICEDFFHHTGSYGLVLEQTFFCALHPSQRETYALHMQEILKPGGKIAGVLFNKTFEGGPPFGGNTADYQKLFSQYFIIEKMEPCYNSILPRQGSELFFVLKKLD